MGGQVDSRATSSQPQFVRCNVFETPTKRAVAHGGEGHIDFARVLVPAQCEGAVHFVDVAVLAPGVSIGLHEHGLDEEEYYLVLEGQGQLQRDGERLEVVKGDLIRNRPGGSHSLVNTGEAALWLFVFEVSTR